MYERRRARMLLAVLTLVSLALVTVDARAGESGPLARVRAGVAAVFGPVQEGLTSVIEPVTDAFGGVSELFRIRQENADLRAELDELRDRRESVTDVKRENERLRELLDMRDTLLARSSDFEVLSAGVTGFLPSNTEWTVSIDVGSRDGVAEDMTVVNGRGLVGRIVQVGPTSSRVLLAVDHTFSAAARVAGSGEFGYVRGNGNEPLEMTLLDPEAEVDVGDEVVTASYQQALFPESIPVGVVEEVFDSSGELTREVVVRPFVDFTRLDVVLVVLRAPPPAADPLPTPGADAEEPLAPPTPAPSPSALDGSERPE